MRIGANTLVLPPEGTTMMNVGTRDTQYTGRLTLIARAPKREGEPYPHIGDYLLVHEGGGTFWASMKEPKKYAPARYHIFHVVEIDGRTVPRNQVVVHDEWGKWPAGRGNAGRNAAYLALARFEQGVEECREVARRREQAEEERRERQAETERRQMRFDFVTTDRVEVLRTGTDVRLRYFDHEYILRGLDDGWVEIQTVSNQAVHISSRLNMAVAFRGEEV